MDRLKNVTTENYKEQLASIYIAILDEADWRDWNGKLTDDDFLRIIMDTEFIESVFNNWAEVENKKEIINDIYNYCLYKR